MRWTRFRAAILLATVALAPACGATPGSSLDDAGPSSSGGTTATGGHGGQLPFTMGGAGGEGTPGSGGSDPPGSGGTIAGGGGSARGGAGAGGAGSGGTSAGGAGSGGTGMGRGGAGPGTGGAATGGTGPGTGGKGTGGSGAGGVGTGGMGTGGASTGTGGTGTGGVAPVTGSGLFSAPAPWYQDITNAPLDAESAMVIQGLLARGGWGTTAHLFQIDFSIDVLHADAGLVGRPFTKTADFFTPDCDSTPVPLPPGGNVEGSKDYACPRNADGDLEDCHLIVIQGKRLFEMWRADIAGGGPGGTFMGGCLAVWDLNRNYWNPASPPGTFGRGEQCSSADAAGYPITDLLFDADEVKAGEIKHAIRFILPNDRIRKGTFMHPATHSGGGRGTPTPDMVPYGARFRLKRSFDLATLPNAGARVVARALQRYGMFLADGGNVALTGKSDAHTTAKWSGLLAPRDLAVIKVSDFEMVEGSARIPLTFDCNRTPLTQ